MSHGDPLRVRDYLEHIAEAIANIQDYIAGMNTAAFMSDRKTQDAVVRNFEVIGEACNNVIKHHPQFAAATPRSRGMSVAYEMRNALAHGYFKVDRAVVWRTIEADLPGLSKAVHAALNSLSAA